MTPIKAIRLKCRDCQSGSLKGIRLCQSEECSLFLYRMGKNPNRSGIGRRDGVFQKKKPAQYEISNQAEVFRLEICTKTNTNQEVNSRGVFME